MKVGYFFAGVVWLVPEPERTERSVLLVCESTMVRLTAVSMKMNALQPVSLVSRLAAPRGLAGLQEHDADQEQADNHMDHDEQVQEISHKQFLLPSLRRKWWIWRRLS
jgi:hypothetical protein